MDKVPNEFPLVYIIIVNWNGWQNTCNCLTSLESVSYPNFEILIIDNGSTDGSTERIKSSFPHVRIIELQENLGFSGGNNQGILYALNKGADYVLLLNNDVIVDPSFLISMVELFEQNSDIGAVNPKIYYLNHAKEKVLWGAGGKTNLWLAASGNRGQDEVDRGQFDEPTEVDFVTGCCMLMSREALILTGLFDQAYFIYYDDVDWSFRLQRRGLTTYYTPHAKIWHAVSAANMTIESGRGTLKPTVHFLTARNHLWLVRRYSNYAQKLTAYPAYFLRRMVYYSAAFILLQRREKLQRLWEGFWAGLQRKPGYQEPEPLWEMVEN
jgi:GT2 family glycosyltransferase